MKAGGDSSPRWLARRATVAAKSSSPARASPRRLHGAAEGHVVGRIDGQPQPGEGVPDLLALVEAHAADDHVRDARAAQRVFEHARLRVGPIEDGDAVPADRIGARLEDRLRDEVRLLVLVPAAIDGGRLALGVLRPQGLLFALLVVCDHVGGEYENAL